MNVWTLTPLVGTLLYFREPIFSYTRFITTIILSTVTQCLQDYFSQTENIGNSLLINYRHRGIPYQLLVPYDIMGILNHNKHQTYIDNRFIKHQPGIPYLVSAEDLEVDHIRIIDENGKESLFSNKEIPFSDSFDSCDEPYDCN